MARSSWGRRLPLAARLDIERTFQVARQDMAIGLTSLFRALPDGAKRRYLSLAQDWNGGTVAIDGPELSQFDQAVLFAVLALAAQGMPPLAAILGLTAPDGLITDRSVHNRALGESVVIIDTTMSALARMAGSDPESCGARDSIRASLKRLSTIVVEGRTGDDWAITHLLHSAVGRGREPVTITLSYRLTRALLGIGSYAAVSMLEYRALPPNVPRLLFAWLCSWYAGSTGERRIGFEALETHVYGGIAKNRSTRSRRRKALREALRALGAIQWRTTVEGDLVTINRPRLRSDERTSLACNRNCPSVQPVSDKDASSDQAFDAIRLAV